MALRDERLLTLSAPALLVAAEAGARVMPGWPSRDVTAVEFLPDHEAVRFRFGGGPSGGFLDLQGAQLAALVIGYLIGVGIPMPSRAPKTITVTAGGIQLRLVTHHATAPRRRAGPLRVRF